MSLTEKLILIFLMLTWVVPGEAQDTKFDEQQQKPDLSGRWVLDRARSNMEPLPEGMTADDSVVLEIKYREPEFDVIRNTIHKNKKGPSSREGYRYFTDGRGESNYYLRFLTPGARDEPFKERGVYAFPPVKSKTEWAGDKIVVKVLLPQPRRKNVNVIVEVTDEWQLSSDRESVRLTETVKALNGMRIITEVYQRSP